MLLDGRRLVITGVLNDDSIAFHCARLAQSEGADRKSRLAGSALVYAHHVRLSPRSQHALP